MNKNSRLFAVLWISLIVILMGVSTGFWQISAQKIESEKITPKDQPDQPDLSAIAPTLGNYPNAMIGLSGNTTVTPDAPPVGATGINVSTNSSFKGTLVASPATGVVRISNAHPAGTYTVTVRGFDASGSTTRTFTLTVGNGNVCNGAVIFTNAADVPVGANGAADVAVGDFNNDGQQDLAAANPTANTVSIRLGNGLGGFTGTTDIGVNGSPLSVAVGDFNNDGNQDFATANSNTNTVSIRLGNGTGSFSGTTDVAVTFVPQVVVVGDFNNDGNQDFANTGFFSAFVSVRLGDGAGNFSSAPDVPIGGGAVSGSNPFGIALGDFNNDGNRDFAVANSFSNPPPGGTGIVSIRLGNGSGGFSAAADVSIGAMGVNPLDVAVGDFNNDGNQDIATTSNGSMSTVSIRLGNGSGGFSGTTEANIGNNPLRRLKIGDFNNDGNQDFAASGNVTGNGSVFVRLGNGTGGFSGTTDVGVNNAPDGLAIGDFNNDGRQDFAVSSGTGFAPVRLGGCAPVTAASVTVGGRVLTTDGRGIGRVRITITDSAGATRTAVTNQFGFYFFTDVPVGEAYIFSALAKEFRFSTPTQIRVIVDNINDIDFIAD